MNLYSVSRWNELYENNRSRIVSNLKWVPVPNSHDGEAYARLMARKDAAKVFAAWILILQIASRCSPRGDLIKSDGFPHDPESLSLRTRAPATWFADSLPILERLGWLSQKAIPDKELALGCRDAAPMCREPVTEQKGREGKGRKGILAGAPRERNEAFDALCLFEGIPLDQIGDAGSRIGKALASINRITPAVTPQEIRRRGENYATHFPNAAKTASALAKHWGKSHESNSSTQHAAHQKPNSRAYSQTADYSGVS